MHLRNLKARRLPDTVLNSAEVQTAAQPFKGFITLSGLLQMLARTQKRQQMILIIYTRGAEESVVADIGTKTEALL